MAEESRKEAILDEAHQKQTVQAADFKARGEAAAVLLVSANGNPEKVSVSILKKDLFP